jgi:hypothetical protein
MRPTTLTVGPLASAAANAIATSQTPTAGPITLNGALAVDGVAYLDTARRVLITVTGLEVNNTFTITGLDRSLNPQSETLAGVNVGTIQSVLDYLVVESVTIAVNADDPLTVGTSDVASSRWIRFDDWAPSAIGIQCTVSGTVNYTVQQTLQDPNSPTNPVAAADVVWVSHPDTDLVAATGTAQGNYAYPPVYARVTLNSGSGSVSGTFLQASNGPI